MFLCCVLYGIIYNISHTVIDYYFIINNNKYKSMKKYISLFAILVLIFVVSVKITKAEDSGTLPATINENTSAETSTNINIPVKIKGVFREKIESQIKKLKAERAAIKTEVQDNNEEAKQRIQILKEDIRNQIKSAREQAKQKMEDLKIKIREEKDKIKSEREQTRIDIRERALERFDKIVEKITNLKDRVNSQIVKFEARGVDVVNAKDFVVTAETKLNEAEAKIAEINVLLSASVGQLTAEEKTTLRTLTQDTQTLVKEAHQALIDAIKSLKDNLKKLDTAVNANMETTPGENN